MLTIEDCVSNLISNLESYYNTDTIEVNLADYNFSTNQLCIYTKYITYICLFFPLPVRRVLINYFFENLAEIDFDHLYSIFVFKQIL